MVMKLSLYLKKDEIEGVDDPNDQEVVRPTKPPRPKEDEANSEG